MAKRSNQRQCRVPGCGTMHNRNLFCCKYHWYQLPKPMRDAIWQAYRDHGAGSLEWLQAAENADAYFEGRDAKDIAAELEAEGTA